MSAWVTSTSPRPSRTSGSSRASRAASATCSTSLPRSSRRSSTSPRPSSCTSTTRSAWPTWASCPTRSRPRSSSSTLDREEQFGELEERLARRRDFFATGATDGFDEDDEYWARTLDSWAEEQGFPPLDEARELANGVLKDVARRIAGEDTRKVRELVRSAAVREDRQLSARELDAVAAWAKAVARRGRDRPSPTSARARARPSRNGKKAVDRLAALPGRRRRRARRQEGRRPPRARARGRGPARRRSSTAPAASAAACWPTSSARRPRPPGGGARRAARPRQRPLPEDRRPHVEGRRQDARGLGASRCARRTSTRRRAARTPTRRPRSASSTLREAFELFKKIKPKDVVGDERLFRELQGPLRLRVGLRRLLRRRHGRRGDPRAAAARGPRRPRARPPRDHQDLEGPAASSARSSASRSSRRSASRTTSRTGWCSTRSR